MKEVLGDFLTFVARFGLIACVAGLVAGDLMMMLRYLPFGWTVVGLVLFPVTALVFPIYALVALDSWTPLVFTYLGPLLCGLMLWFGIAIKQAARH